MIQAEQVRGDPPVPGAEASRIRRLESVTSVDPTRPLIEFYKRHDEIERGCSITDTVADHS